MSTELNIPDSVMERLPPQSVEAEQAVLGGLLVTGDAISRVVDILQPDNFYRKAHQVIYASMLDLFDKSEPIDSVTVAQYLKDEGKLEHVGGRQYLVDLSMSVATTANLEYYARTVRDKATLRNLIKAGTEIVSHCYEETDADSALDRAESMIFGLAQNRDLKQLQHIKYIVNASFAKIEERYENRDSLSGIPSGFYDLDILTSGFQPSDLIIIAARPSMGKCLSHDSEIVLQDGTIATIKEIYDRQTAKLLTLSDDYKLDWTAPTAYVDDGVKPVFKVTTRLGRSIQTTITHPFLTINGWKKLSEITAGQKIAVPRNIPVQGYARIRDCEAKLLAYLIGDGCLTNGKVNFTNTNPTIQGDFIEAVNEFGDVTVRQERSTDRAASFTVRKNRRAIQLNGEKLREQLNDYLRHNTGRSLAKDLGVTAASVSHWRSGKCMPDANIARALSKQLSSAELSVSYRAENSVVTWLKSLDLYGRGSHDKTIPPMIFGLINEQIALFLNRLFATDGWATVYATGQSQIGYCSVSEKLVRQIQHLLLRFGVIAELRARSIAYRNERRQAWQLEITDKRSLEAFIGSIGIFGKEQAVARISRSVATRHTQTNCDLIPMPIWQNITVAKGAESWASLGRRAGIRSHTNMHVNKRELTRPKLLNFSQALNNRDLANLASSDVYWDEIVSIEYAGEQQVYDLTIPETHNFIANDICVHNTAFVLNVAQHVALEKKVPVAIFSLEMSKEQLVQRMLCSEAGIDSNRLRTGFLQNNDWNRLAIAMGRLGEAPVFIDDSAVVSALEVRAKCRRLKAEMKELGLVIIDYIQLMQGRKATDNRVQEVSEISRSLKQLARELSCPVMALSQLSRAVEQRQNKRPMLSDLRESGCLTGDSLVFMPETGAYVRIDSLVGNRDFTVASINTDSWKLENGRVINSFPTGVKQVFRLTTRLNRTIRATANHKFLTIDGWQRLDELIPGFRIAVPRHLQSSAQSTLSNDQLALLGYLIGDGCTAEHNNKRALSRTRASKVAAVVDSPKLSKLAASDVYWDEIISIEPDGIEEVYDLTVEHLHNFVANDIIVHNSIEQDADVVGFIYRDEYYNPESEHRGEAEIIIAKQRNGPTGTVELLYQASITRFLNKVHKQTAPAL
jgi:replicative DNA helicase